MEQKEEEQVYQTVNLKLNYRARVCTKTVSDVCFVLIKISSKRIPKMLKQIYRIKTLKTCLAGFVEILCKIQSRNNS